MGNRYVQLGPEYKPFGGVASKSADGVYATVNLGGGAGIAVGDSGETGFAGPMDGFFYGIVATAVTTGFTMVIEALIPNIAGDTTERWEQIDSVGVSTNLALGAAGSLNQINFGNMSFGAPKKIRVSIASRTDGTLAFYWLPFTDTSYPSR